jgi:hypothetical protein
MPTPTIKSAGHHRPDCDKICSPFLKVRPYLRNCPSSHEIGVTVCEEGADSNELKMRSCRPTAARDYTCEVCTASDILVYSAQEGEAGVVRSEWLKNLICVAKELNF